jgi:hypothetical protein
MQCAAGQKVHRQPAKVDDVCISSVKRVKTVEGSPDQMMLCIICMKMKPRRTSGGEHVIPYAMGGSFTIRRVCLDCDNRLGNTADAGLINLSSIEQRRVELELAGHRGEPPHPLRSAMKTRLTSAADPMLRVKLRPGSQPGEIVGRTLPYVEFDVQRFPEGTLIQPARVYIDPTDVDKAEALAAQALRVAGISDDSAVKRMAREFADSLQHVEETHLFKQTIEVRVGGHEDGLLKIAYELAWYWLGDSWLDDPAAVAMRDKLNGRVPSGPIRGKIYDDANVGVVAMEGDPRVVHVGYVYPVDGQMVLFVRIFDLMTVGFAVTADASKYTVPEKNAIVMQNVERKYEETAFGPIEPGAVAWHHDPNRSGFNRLKRDRTKRASTEPPSK